jgi:FkbM family methyltransferase
MIGQVARLANDSYSLWRTPYSARQKAELWFHSLLPSRKMLGFDILYFDRAALRYLYREIFVRQYYYFRTENDSPLIFDCGANIGMATLYFKWLYPRARIESFEPDPMTFAVLERNIAHNRLAGVTAHNCALWSGNGEIEFLVDEARPGSLLMSAVPSRHGGQAIRVPSQKLSNFVAEPIDFLKLDVEGSESCILSDLISSKEIRRVRQMVIEYHHRIGNQHSCLAEFLRQLDGAGFQYQIHASLWPVSSKGVFQDMLIGAYREDTVSTGGWPTIASV